MNDWRKPCEHGEYEYHVAKWCKHGQTHMHTSSEWACAGPDHCPGGSLVTAADLEGLGERDWICWYPEFGDRACLEDHDIRATRQPRKHTDCGWRLLIPIPDPQPERPLPQWTLTEEGWVWDDSIPDPQPATEWGPDHPSYDEMGQ